LALHDAQEALHKDLERLINTAKPEHKTVSLYQFPVSVLWLMSGFCDIIIKQ